MHAPRQAVQPSSVGFAGSRPKESRLRPNSYPPAAAVGGAPTSSSGSCQVVGAHFLLKDINSLQARLAQSVEHETLNLRVVGSSPTLGVVFAAYLDSWLTWVGLLLPAVNFRFTTALLEAEGADIQIPAHLRKPA